MPLNWSRVSWRPQKGLNTYVDELSLGSEYASKFEDVTVQGGLTTKRDGFARLSQLSLVDDEVKSIFQHGDELCAITKKRLYGYSESDNSWIERGHVPIGSGELTPILEDEGKATGGAVCMTEDSAGNKYYIEMAQLLVESSALGTLDRTRIVLHIKDENGSTVHIDHAFTSEGTTPATTVHSPKAVRLANNKVIIAYAIGWNFGVSPYTSGDVRCFVWNPETPTTAPTLIHSVFDMRKHDGPEWSPYDIVAISADEWVFAYCKDQSSYGSINVTALDDAGNNVFATSTRDLAYFNEPQQVAIEYDSVDNEVMVLVSNNASGTWTIQYQTLGYIDTLPVAVSAYTIDSWSSSTPVAIGLSAPGTDENSDRQAIVAWSWAPTNEMPDTYYTAIRPAALGPFTDNIVTCYNCSLIVTPWWKNSRAYMGLLSHQESVGFNMPFVIDTGVGDADIREFVPDFFMVAAWDFGAGPANEIGTYGTTEVTTGYYKGAADKVYFDGEVVGFPATSIGTVEVGKARFEQNHVKLDYSFRPIAVPSVRGGTIITGSVVAWYDGVRVFELGCAGTPNVISARVTSGGIDETSTTSYQFYWRGPDALGVVHRGVPGVPYEAPNSGEVLNGEGYTLDVLTHSCTMLQPGLHRYRVRSPIGFAAGTDASVGLNANFQRFTPPGRCEGNWLTKDIPITDDGSGYGPVIYTTDGQDLEAEFPPGCKFAATARDRCWLVGQYRGDKALYSDKLVVGDLTADIYAPEFNAAFGYNEPSGRRFTGAAELSDNVVLFTEDGIYAVSGFGPDNASRGNDFSGIVQISDDYGCIEPHSIVDVPQGIFFRSHRGLCLLSDDLTVQYVPHVSSYFTSSHECLRAVHDNRSGTCYFLMRYFDGDDYTHFMLLFNTIETAWSYWTLPSDFIDCCIKNGTLWCATASGYVWRYGNGFSSDAVAGGYNAPVATPWLKLGDSFSDRGNVRAIYVKGKYITGEDRNLEVRVYYDYIDSVAETHEVAWANLSSDADQVLEVRVRPGRGKCSAIKVEILDKPNSPNNHAFQYQGIDFEVGRSRGGKRMRQEKKS